MYGPRIRALVAEHGEVPPPWAYYPRVHPFDIHWRMLDWVADFLWPDDFSGDVDEPSEEHFARMEAFGFGSRSDWSRCSEVEPDAYPLADDTSSRWLEKVDRG